MFETLLEDHLFARIFIFVVGCYPFALAVFLTAVFITQPTGGFWAILLLIFIGLFYYFGLRLIILAFEKRQTKLEKECKEWLSVGGSGNILGEIFVFILMIFAGFIAFILSTLIRYCLQKAD